MPEQVSAEMKRLLDEYNSKEMVTLEDVLAFHVRFERIHPFPGRQRTCRAADYVQGMPETQYIECFVPGLMPCVLCAVFAGRDT